MALSQTIDSVHLIGNSDAMQQLYKMIGRVCNTECSVLLIGEKGSGKGVVARAIHYFSHRSAFPFQILRGREAQLSSDEVLLGIDESHQAEGTLYLTEFTEIPYFVHERLSTIQRTHQYKCSHQNKPRGHRLRFIVGDEGKIRDDLQKGSMPADLFYDWNFLPLYVPPLRDRKEDIPLLAEYFLKTLALEMKISQKELAPEAMETLVLHDWPGNISELKEVLRTALQNCRGNYVRSDHFVFRGKDHAGDAHALTQLEIFLNTGLSHYVDGYTEAPGGGLYPILLPQMEKSLFEYAMKKSKGNKHKAAEILGLHRNTLLKKLQKYSI